MPIDVDFYPNRGRPIHVAAVPPGDTISLYDYRPTGTQVIAAISAEDDTGAVIYRIPREVNLEDGRPLDFDGARLLSVVKPLGMYMCRVSLYPQGAGHVTFTHSLSD